MASAATARTSALKDRIRVGIEEGWNKNDWPGIEANYDPALVVHTPGAEPFRSRDEFAALFAMVHEAFPDYTLTIEEIAAEGNRAAVLFTASGTHLGPYLGVPATGKRVSVREINFYEFADPQLIELWPIPDVVGILTQISEPPPRALIKALGLIDRARNVFRQTSTYNEPDRALANGGLRTNGTLNAEEQDNKAALRRAVEGVWAGPRWDAAEELYADDVRVETTRADHVIQGRDELAAVHETLHASFSDLRMEIGDVIADGDLAAVRWRTTATHSGEAFGLAATGKQVRFLELMMARFADGKATHVWWLLDRAALMAQLGLIPSGPPPAPVAALMKLGSKLRRR